MIRNVLCVALGGALGSVARYLVSKWVQESVGSAFPVGTMAVNVVGCLLIGIFYVLADRYGFSGEAKLFLTVGLCGGFTTFSTFMNENLLLLRGGSFILALIYAGLSVMLGLAAVYAGRMVFAANS